MLLALRCFVAAEALFGFFEPQVLTHFAAVLLQTKFFRRVLYVFGGVINTLAGFRTHESNNFTFFAFFSHYV